MGFERGARAGEKRSKEKTFTRREGVAYLRLKEDGESVYFIPVHDGYEWYVADTHSFVPSKLKGDDGKQKFLGAVCRKDKTLDYDECYICDVLHTVTPNPRTKNAKIPRNRGRYFSGARYYIPVLVLQEVTGTQEMIDAGDIEPMITLPSGKKVSTLDRVVARVPATVEVDETDADGNPTGKKVERPDVRLWVTTWEQGASALTNEFELHETVCNRPFRLKRDGTQLDTSYELNAVNPMGAPNLADPVDRKPYDIIDVEKLLTEQSSDEYYGRLFDHRVQNEDDDPADTSDASPAPEVDQAHKDKLAEIKAQMKRGTKLAAVPDGDED